MGKWEFFKELVGNALLIAYGLFFIWVFSYVMAHGSMKIIEDNPYILWIEVIGALLIVLIGAERLYRDLKGRAS